MRHTWIMVAVLIAAIILGCFVRARSANRSRSTTSETMNSRIYHLSATANHSVLAHIHIPKAGGTALAAALSSNCECKSGSLPNCSNCTRVVGNDGTSVRYSYSRSTGSWHGSVHSPYYVAKDEFPRYKQWENLRRGGIHPVYIIMLRRPFDRFVSEIVKWGGHKGQAVDWSIVNYHHDGNDTYYPGANSSFFYHGDKNENPAHLEQRLQYYASLPAIFTFHNRYVKMVGGPTSNWPVQHFRPERMLGAKWHPEQNNITDAELLSRSLEVLGKERDVLLLLEERFAESICTLEILYGHLYRFNWDPTVHSHHTDIKIDFSAIIATPEADRYPAAYRAWQWKNKEDERLYKMSEEIFQAQFTAALNLLKQLRAQSTGDNQQNVRVPHCEAFEKDV